ncbi:UDP-2,4-diacetamido-2,4,6-trideoxy-beta-L-altropyranose hydrolase [Ferribacterium limneticum]|uniref:UDP-2,4-diacetamido-2,4, 6-trideoxy-beta-L-altropyranose hydrolase n=1 Tax=Ferribacterium limneticum TaxID=76259 RepID=UPI001CFBD2D4|nr:UDP-2,4-diacetamido-2,4,6-trideoxy-beta-L-altropyranose hydrolase [Ferribacterium limneticum]UCV27634.1 UDP-2,4-diacetamido-2,4,6-trideoxy-beta-L-altropyranose hydrolase [Ferribacterium limneticum]UCV31551.1 UDP-2,4-diacetamido-2,4,6-trideoxy-beta-L-altropyranose hydrolase [Ferribacterium limneticum]
MKFLIRADSSTNIGAGHVVRCATLAGQLRLSGHDTTFLSRRCPGNLNDWLSAAGHKVLALPSEWHDEQADAAASLNLLGEEDFDGLVVDHYHLDTAWEKQLANRARRTMAIDDLARPHAVDLLLDQNFPNQVQARYQQVVPATCRLLLGPAYALVRPEFAASRPAALARRRGQLERLLVCMGGCDAENETTKVLAGIAQSRQRDLAIDVVIGAGNPHRAVVEAACLKLPRVLLHVQTNRMAELMVAADCAITAGGSTTWERCTLGLPGLVTTVADNQIEIARAVHDARGHDLLGWYADLAPWNYALALDNLTADHLYRLSAAAATICDGQGAARVATCLIN